MRAVFMLIGIVGCDEKEPTPIPAPVEELVEAPVTEPVATPEPPPVASGRISARHILVAWKGSVGAESALRRTQSEARVRAELLLGRVRSGEDFAAVAMEASDGPSRVLGGDLGPFEADAMHADFSARAFTLNLGEISELVETPFGYHIIQRTALEEVHVAHVLVQWEGVHRSEVTRTPEEARVRAEEALSRLQAGETLEAVAAALSDGPTGLRGGDLGWFQRGQMVPAFDEAAFALKAGGISDIVESPLGLHIIVRLE